MTWDRLRDPSPRTDWRVDEQYFLTMKENEVLSLVQMLVNDRRSAC